MAPREHSRSRCADCDVELVRLTGDPTMPYEEIDPLEGGPRTLVQHTEERCKFHQFLTPTPGRHTLPGNANWDGSLINTRAAARWIRVDPP